MKVFDEDINIVNGGCNPWNGNPCTSPEKRYYVSIETDDCQEWIPITVIGSSSISSMPNSPVQNANSLGGADFRDDLDDQKQTFETSLEIANLFPNPVHIQLTLELNSTKAQEGVLRIFDINGRVVVEKILSINKEVFTYSVDVQTLPPGVYQLSIFNGQESLKERFVKH